MSTAVRVFRSRRLVAPLALVLLSACGAATSTQPQRSPGSTAPVPATTAHPSSAATASTTSTSPVIETAPPAPGPVVGPGTQARYTVEPQPTPGTCHYRWVGADPLPDPSCTPGATNPGVTPDDLGATICASGWTATVRPPTSVTSPEKAGSAAAYGYTGPSATAEYDHLVPLELGGDPNDPANLWLEPNDRPGATSFANGKDGLENRLRTLVCAGRLPLAEAQRAIATDWAAALQHYGA